jgi:hypothetical protein
MKNVWRILTLPCEEAARLMSDERDAALSRLDRIALRAHLLSCKSCKRFRRHVHVIAVAARSDEPMPEDARERISQAISKLED